MATTAPTAADPAAPHTPTPATTTTTTTTTKDSRLAKTTAHLKYLYDPTNSPQPSRLRTRSLLRSARYIAIFIFWRLFRYAKYAATGALVAAVAGTAFGSVVSGAAFVVAPTGILGGAGVGLVWAAARFGWRFVGPGRRGGEDPRKDEEMSAVGEEEKPVRMSRVEPW